MGKLSAVFRALRRAIVREIRDELIRERIQTAFPGTHFEWPLRFEFDELDALQIGANSSFGAFSEIVVLRRSPYSLVEGGLSVGMEVRIGSGANLRAAGGKIAIGSGTQIGQHVSIIASNHLIDPISHRPRVDAWDSTRTGVSIGANCWIGAGSIILPGVTIARNAVIGAGSVVTKAVADDETWIGQAARPLLSRGSPQAPEPSR
jgi:acetyltransferase-like isoleucine patch superfamily enzyme